MKIKKFPLLILPVITLILEALPYGAVLNFAEPEGESVRKTFSYFSLVPFGYANFAPLITAIITCLVFVLLLIYCIKEKTSVFRYAWNLTVIGIVLSLCPLGFGLDRFSLVALLISVSLVAELILLFYIKPNRKPR